MRRRNFFLLLILLILVTRLPLLWENYFHSDEALFALSAKIWMAGGIPYVDWIETKPLGVYFFYSLAGWMTGNLPNISMRAVHLLTMVWTLLTAWSLSVIVRKLLPDNRQRGWRNPEIMAGVFFVLFSSFWDPTIVSTSIEVVLLLPLCLGIAVLPTEPEDLGPVRCFLAGLCAAAAFLCKYQAGMLIPIILAYFCLILWKDRSAGMIKKISVATFFFGLGLIPLPILMITYLKAIGAWQGFVFWNVLGNYLYIRDGNTAAALGRVMVTQVGRYIGSTLLLWLLAASRARHLWRERNNPGHRVAYYEWLIWLWLILSVVPVSVGKRFEDHYFLFLTPAFSILAAMALNQWSPEIWQRRRRAVLVGILLPALAFTVTRYLFRPIDRILNGEDIASYKPYADYLKEHTAPGDPIFLWGCAPSVYLDADRMPSSRFLRTDVLAGRVAGIDRQVGQPVDPSRFMIPGTWEMFFDDLRRHPPAYIMDMAPTGMHDFALYPMTNYPELMEFINRRYVREPSFEKADVYRRILL